MSESSFSPLDLIVVAAGALLLVTAFFGWLRWRSVRGEMRWRAAALEEARRRDAILDAVAFTAQRLLETEDWESAIGDILRRLGEAMRASRVRLVEYSGVDSEEMRFTQHSVWDAPGVVPQADNPAMRDVVWRESPLKRWMDILGRNEIVADVVSELPNEEREFLAAQGARSVLVVPVWMGEKAWGALGLHDCATDRIWAPGEVDALRAVAGALGSALQRAWATRELRGAEAKFRTLVEQVPAVTHISRLDESSSTIYMSPQVEEMLGYAPEEWVADPHLWEKVLHSDDREKSLAGARDHMRTHAPVRVEYRMISKDGRTVWVREDAVVVRDAAGDLVSQGVIRDVTDWRESEERVREAEAKYRGLVEQVPAVIYIWDCISPTVPVTYMSPQLESLVGFSPEEWISDPKAWYRHVHPDDVEQARRAADRAGTTGEPLSIEYRFRRRDGEEVWVRDDAVLVSRDEGGRPWMWRGVLQNVTDRKGAETRLREAEARFRTLVEQVPAITYVWPADRGTPGAGYVSPQVVEVLGYSPEEWHSRRDFWEERLHPDDRKRVLAAAQHTEETREPFDLEYRYIAKDGRAVWIWDRGAFVDPEASGGRELFEGVMLDITKRKRAEEERGILLGRLVAAQEEERKRIAGDIHDDSVQKMTAVGLRLEMLERRLGDSQDAEVLAQLQQTVSAAIGRLRHLLFELRPPALDREGLAAALRQYLDETAVESGFDAELESRLVEDPPVEARLIAYRIAQEAVTNACKHSGGKNVRVLVEPREEGTFVRVGDDGTGSLETGDGQDGVPHLGLSAMRDRAQLAGGWWRIDAVPGRGTTVEFWIPSRPSASAAVDA